MRDDLLDWAIRRGYSDIQIVFGYLALCGLFGLAVGLILWATS